MEVPSEIWLLLTSYLSVSDKCSFLTACRAIKQTIYKDSFWLDFALKNLLRGLTIEEIIVLVFLKADQERLLQSRISKIQNHLKIKYGASLDIQAIVTQKGSKPASEISFGNYNGIAWREYGTYIFACNFVALFCRPVKLIAIQGEEDDMKLMWDLHGTSITDLTRNKSMTKNTEDLCTALPNLVKYKALGGEFVHSVLQSMAQNMTRLQALTLSVDDGQLNTLAAMTNLTKLKDTLFGKNDKEKLLEALGPKIRSLCLGNMTEADMKNLAKHCKQLHSLRIMSEEKYPEKVFETMSELAKNSAQFPKKLKLVGLQKMRTRNPHSFGVNEDSSFFFQNFGSRLVELKLHDIAYSHFEHLVHVSNIVKLDLRITDAAATANGAANITVPQMITKLSKLVELELELATTHRVNISHPHLTKLQLRLEDAMVDTPALVDLCVFNGAFGIKSCALKSLYIGTAVSGLHDEMNVDWSALESLSVTMDRDMGVCVYWQLVDKMPLNVVLKKGCVKDGVDLPFRVTKNQSVMPPNVRITVAQVRELAHVDYVAQPKELTVESPPSDLKFYEILVSKFPAVESLDFYYCGNITTEALDVMCHGLSNLKQIGFTESRDVNVAFNHLKLHSRSLELIYLYHIHSVETSDIQCPNARTIKFDNAGRYEFLNNVTDTNLCEKTLQQISETNACPNLMNYDAYPSQTYPDGMYDLKRPAKPVKLTQVPAQLITLRSFLTMNLVEVDFESDNLTEASFNGCYHLKHIKIKAPLRYFTTDAPLISISLDSKLLRTLSLTSTQLEHIELNTPRLKELFISSPITYDFIENLGGLEKITVLQVQQRTYKYVEDNEVPSPKPTDAAAMFAKLLSSCPLLTEFNWYLDDTPLVDEFQRNFEAKYNKLKVQKSDQ